jgi:2-oxoglutarate dehydrogenase E1 component
LERAPVRLSGQDCGRGTFSQRHIVWVDQENEEKYIAINHMNPQQSLIEIVDSPLAEASVLGFEYGYSVTNPKALVLWEAQFGDFSNGAQVIIDQFISSGEHKWGRKSNLVLLLPHGFEGQGPEHSSARIERYLQLCAENNMRVVNCSTPANYFHALRRQVYSAERKPLIVFSPKTLLRHKMAVSSFNDMGEGTCFMSVLGDPDVHPSRATRVILCSGKIYYELLQKRVELGAGSVALIRLEQYHPFPHNLLAETLAPYQKAEFFWCQEEPMNMGAWPFLDRRLEAVLHEIGAHTPYAHYIGRPEAAAPATGISERHAAEQDYIINHALVGFDHTVYGSQKEPKGIFGR